MQKKWCLATQGLLCTEETGDKLRKRVCDMQCERVDVSDPIADELVMVSEPNDL